MKKAIPGKNPASAIPSRKRATTKLLTPVASAVPAEHSPQATAINVIQRRAPIRDSAAFAGI